MTPESKATGKLPQDKPHATLDQDQLEFEFSLFTNYLVGEVTGDEFFDRYVSACQKRLTDCAPSLCLDSVLKNPWMLGPVDAALGITSPGDELRRKLVIATAILEASPDYTEHFLSSNRGIFHLIIRLGWTGFTSMIKLIVGLIIINFISIEPHLRKDDQS